MSGQTGRGRRYPDTDNRAPSAAESSRRWSRASVSSVKADQGMTSLGPPERRDFIFLRQTVRDGSERIALAAETMAGRDRRFVSSSTLAELGRRARKVRMFRMSDPRH